MRSIVVSIVLLLVALHVHAATDTIQAKLEAMQPAQLPESRTHAQYVVYDRWPGHEPRTILATVVIDDAGTKELRVFRVRRTGELQPLASRGGDPRHVALRDVRGDGTHEVFVYGYPGNRSTPIEILRWDGRELALIGETSSAATEVDLDHDGIAEFVTRGCCQRNACGDVISRPWVQKFRNGKLGDQENPTLAAVFVETKQTSKTETMKDTIILPDSFSTSCRLRVVNGTAGGRHRATGVELVVLTAGDQEPSPQPRVRTRLTRHTEYVELPIILPSPCAELEVTVTGPAGATVTIVVDTASVNE